VYDEDKDALMFDADLFVLPSRYENFANSAAEAMAHGVPVVVTKSCGIRSVVQGQAGLVIELGKGALTEAIRRLIDDRALYAAMKEGCRRVAERLAWNQLAEQMESHYAEATAIST
jgi:glycosyltransferase involved in cell wall biosynthesis